MEIQCSTASETPTTTGESNRNDVEYEILSRADLLGLGVGLLLHRGYPFHLSEDISLDALYLCAKSYKGGKGANIKTYYNRCLYWVSGHYASRNRRHKNRIRFGRGLEGLKGEEASVLPIAPLRIEVEQLLNILPLRHRGIIDMVILKQYTMADVAELHGVARQRIGQLVAEAIVIIKKRLSQDASYDKFREEIRGSYGKG